MTLSLCLYCTLRASTLTKSLSFINNMRNIEIEMNQAILDNRDWRKANTEVIYNPHSGNSHVYLHGHEIAIIGDHFVKIFDGGYQSQTTKSRLNAICARHCIQGEGIYQKAGEWFVKVIDPKSQDICHHVPFVNGFVFADALR